MVKGVFPLLYTYIGPNRKEKRKTDDSDILSMHYNHLNIFKLNFPAYFILFTFLFESVTYLKGCTVRDPVHFQWPLQKENIT